MELVIPGNRQKPNSGRAAEAFEFLALAGLDVNSLSLPHPVTAAQAGNFDLADHRLLPRKPPCIMQDDAGSLENLTRVTTCDPCRHLANANTDNSGP